MARALRRWPIRLAELGDTSASPDISFVIPHRGRERLPLLRLTLASILAQRGARVECIVVEQSAVSEVDGLPGGVRHIHLPHTTDSQGWRKSWAFNVGVEAARAEIVVCHDGDILVPDQYGSEILFHLNEKGMDAVHLQRFLFCLDAATTAAIQAPAVVEAVACERVDQNWVGGTLAIRKSAYWQIGGFDEGFVGWGGEDKEFFDRCRTVPQYAFGYLPFIHLWHTPQDEKVSDERVRAVEFMKQRLAIPPRERVLELRRLRDEQYQGVITP